MLDYKKLIKEYFELLKYIEQKSEKIKNWYNENIGNLFGKYNIHGKFETIDLEEKNVIYIEEYQNCSYGEAESYYLPLKLFFMDEQELEDYAKKEKNMSKIKEQKMLEEKRRLKEKIKKEKEKREYEEYIRLKTKFENKSFTPEIGSKSKKLAESVE